MEFGLRRAQGPDSGTYGARAAVIGGCTGNTQGVARLAEGRNIDEVIALLKGIQCRGGTSCPDQLARALEEIKQKRSA